MHLRKAFGFVSDRDSDIFHHQNYSGHDENPYE